MALGTPIDEAILHMKIFLPLCLFLSFLVACGDSSDDGGGDDPAPPGGACGGRGGIQCGAGEFCDFSGNSCGIADEAGTCKPRPEACPLLLVAELTCGCDGKVYSSGCDANAAGADLNENGSCEMSKENFKCGYRQCSLNAQYCRYSPSDTASVADSFTCGGLPGCTGNATCDCLEQELCGASCTGDSASGLTLTCPAG